MLHHQGKKPMPILAATPLFHLQSDCRGYKKRPRTATDCTGRHCPYSKWIISSERFLMCLVYRKLCLIAIDILWTIYKIWNIISFGNIAQMPDKSQFSAGSYFFHAENCKNQKTARRYKLFLYWSKKQHFNSISDFLPRFYVVFHKKRAKKGRNSVQMSFFRDVLDKWKKIVYNS